MTRSNATVNSSYQNRDGKWVHYVQRDKGEPVRVEWGEQLPYGRRVRLDDDNQIVEGG